MGLIKLSSLASEKAKQEFGPVLKYTLTDVDDLKIGNVVDLYLDNNRPQFLEINLPDSEQEETRLFAVPSEIFSIDKGSETVRLDVPFEKVLEGPEFREISPGLDEDYINELYSYYEISQMLGIEDLNAKSVLTGGDVEANWEDADSVGDEAVGGSVSTPDKDEVDEIGQAAGLEYEIDEPLDTAAKIEKNSTKRVELEPDEDKT